MVRLCVAPRVAAALIAAAVLVLTVACGSDDDAPTPTASPEAGTATPETTDGSEPPAGTIDLASASPLFELRGANSDDLVTGASSLALGDFNDDNKPDLLIGAPGGDGPDEARGDAGEAYVIFGPLEGSLDLAKESADVTIYGALPGDGLGFTVLSGDLNGDGVDDILVGAQGVTAGFDLRTDQGRVYVFYGGADLEEQYDLASDVFDFTVTGAEGFSRLSYSMGLGDVDGDGTDDLVVGAPFAGRAPGSPPGSQRTGVGEVYIIFGKGELSGEVNIAALQQDVLISGSQGPPDFGQFGSALAVADFDDDGTDDIAIGAHRSNAGEDRVASGSAYLFFGRSDWPERLTIQDGDQDVTISGPDASAAFGFPMTNGDTNGDGVADLIIGAQLEGSGSGEVAGGAVRIFFGGSDLDHDIDLASAEADVTIPGVEPGGILPSGLAASDLDGDGDDDLVLSAMFGGAATGRRSAGVVYVLPGESSLPELVDLAAIPAELTAIGAEEDDRLGNALTAGAVSEDGQGIVLLATSADDGDGTNVGIVYVLRLEIP